MQDQNSRPHQISPEDIEYLKELTKKAGRAIMAVENTDATHKADSSPLTLADTASHNCIVEGLSQRYSKIPIISEEMKEQISFGERKDWKEFWLVDPLDGTKEYIKGLPEFTVNIALIRGSIPVAGFVYSPKMNVMYFGTEAGGSFKVDAEGRTTKISSELKKADLIATVSRSHLDQDTQNFLKERNISKTISIGSSLKFCLLAEGSAHVYPRLSPIMEWDTAAGDAVFRYSGRQGPRFSPLTYNTETMKFSSFIIGDR